MKSLPPNLKYSAWPASLEAEPTGAFQSSCCSTRLTCLVKKISLMLASVTFASVACSNSFKPTKTKSDNNSEYDPLLR